MNKIIAALYCLLLSFSIFSMENSCLIDDGLLRIYFDDNTENYENIKSLSNNVLAYLRNHQPKKAALISSANLIFNALILYMKKNELTDILNNNFIYKYNNFILFIPRDKINFYYNIFAIDSLELIDQASLVTYLAHHKIDMVTTEVNINDFSYLLRDKTGEKVISLPILIFGHGGYHLKKGGGEYVAGLLLKDFRDLLLSFSNTMLRPQFLIYQTCYAGSQHLLLPYYDHHGQALRFDFDIISANPYAIPGSGINDETYDFYDDNTVIDAKYLSLASKMCPGGDILCLLKANKTEFIYFDKDGYVINDYQIIDDIIRENGKLKFTNVNYSYGYIGSNMLFFANKYDNYTYQTNLYDIINTMISDNGYIDFGLVVKYISIRIKDHGSSSYLADDIAINAQLTEGKEYQLKNVVMILKNKKAINLVAQVPTIIIENKKIPVTRGKFINKKVSSFVYDKDDYIFIAQEGNTQTMYHITKREYNHQVCKLLREFILKTPDFLLDYSCNKISDLEHTLLPILSNSNDDEVIANILAIVDNYKTK